jgi:hypothetical protein
MAKKKAVEGMTAEQILKFTLAEPDNRNARYVKVDDLQKMFTTKSRTVKIKPRHGSNPTVDGPVEIKLKTGPFILAKTITSIPGQKPRKHNQVIYLNKFMTSTEDLLPKLSKEKIRCTCDCARFVYNWEYALARRKAAEIKFGNGEPPVKTNPRMIPAPCKHLVKVLTRIIAKKL